jgi:TPP-dependent 2-oxoacid decarboxylase
MAKRVKRKYQDLSYEEKEEFDYLLALRDEIKRERDRMMRVVACHKSRTEQERDAARAAHLGVEAVIIGTRSALKPGDVVQIEGSKESFGVMDVKDMPKSWLTRAVMDTGSLVPLLARDGSIVVSVCTRLRLLTPLEALVHG